MIIKSVKNFFGIGRVNESGDLKGSSYRLIRRDILSSVSMMEKSINGNMDRRHFAAQRKRVEILIEVCNRSESLMHQLLKADSEHNTFRVRFRIEKLKAFLIKSSNTIFSVVEVIAFFTACSAAGFAIPSDTKAITAS